MFIILLFSILGFLAGLIWVMVKRKITFNRAFSLILGLLAVGILKQIFKELGLFKGPRKLF